MQGGVRRVLLENASAVASHCPLPLARNVGYEVSRLTRGKSSPGASRAFMSWLVSAQPRTTFSLTTEQEIQGIRGGARRIILSSCPSKSLIRSFSGSVLNVTLGLCLTPLVFLALLFEKLRAAPSVRAAPEALLYASLWTGFFVALSFYAAVQQFSLGVVNACILSPGYYILNSDTTFRKARFWSDLSCTFEPPLGAKTSHNLLHHFDSVDVIKERATSRVLKYMPREESQVSYYSRLGVQPTASQADIKSAYRRLALKVHPDRNTSPTAAQEFNELREIYKTLCDPRSRKLYDAGGEGHEEVLSSAEKVRNGLRALFGGDGVHSLAGDAFLFSFACRVVDKRNYTQEELLVIRQTMDEKCRDELEEVYLREFTPASTTWERDVLQHLKASKMQSTGLGKEVLLLMGSEYLYVVNYFDMQHGVVSWSGSLSRLRLYVQRKSEESRVAFLRFRALFALARRRGDQAKSVDAAWHWGAPYLQRTVRKAALSLLYDPAITAEERHRRREGIQALGRIFSRAGAAYSPATESSVRRLNDSLYSFRSK